MEEATPKVIARTNTEAIEALKKIQGKPIVNRETGIEAVIRSNQRGKLISNKAADKSVANGFTREQHNTAAANIKDLFERAHLFFDGPDKNAEKEVKSIKRFASLIVFDGVPAEADILLKETEQGGNRIYTVELQEIKMPSERGSESIKVNHDVATPTSDGKIKVAEEAAKVNGIRYSLGFSRGNAETQRIELKEKVENVLKTANGRVTSPTSRLTISQKAEKVKHDGVSQIVDENGEPNVGTYGTENPDIRWSLSQADLPGLENAGWDLFEAVAKEKPEAKPVIDEIKKELTKRVAFDSFRRKPGEHKTLSDIRNTFGLLSLKIGQRAGKKWVSEDEVYDALLDLAEVADIPPAAIGLGGRIQLEVAGRATTRTGGTYAPRKKHITLYHRGALAHEWMHALDNYFGGMFNGFRGKTNPYNSHPVRKEVADAFDNLRDVISESEFAKRSRKERGAYWRTDHEMLARAFEIYAFTKAQYDEEAGKQAHKEAEAILDEYQKQRREGKRFSSEEIDELRSRQKELFENSERLRHFLATDRDSHVRPKKEELESDGITAAFDKLFHELQWEQQGQNV